MSHWSYRSHPWQVLVVMLYLAATELSTARRSRTRTKIHFSPSLVSQFKSDDWRKGPTAGGRRQFRDLLARFSHGIVNDRVTRAFYDVEPRHRSIRLDLEAHIDHDRCTGWHVTLRLVLGAFRSILEELSGKTDAGL